MSNQANTRRQPQQARSKQRFNHILDTAAEVFAEIGIDAATTNLIAERGKIAIGSLYQFFPHKEAIFEALVDRYKENLFAVLSLEGTETLPITTVVRGMVEGIIAFDTGHTGFKAIFTNTDTEIHHEIVARVEVLFSQRFPTMRAERRLELAVGGIAIVKGIMLITYAQDAVSNPSKMMQEALIGYLREVLSDEGIELPLELRIRSN